MSDITTPNECAIRGLRALREYVIDAMEPDDSQQYLDYSAALDWLDCTLANLCEHCDGTTPCVHCGSDPLPYDSDEAMAARLGDRSA